MMGKQEFAKLQTFRGPLTFLLSILLLKILYLVYNEYNFPVSLCVDTQKTYQGFILKNSHEGGEGGGGGGCFFGGKKGGEVQHIYGVVSLGRFSVQFKEFLLPSLYLQTCMASHVISQI